MGNDSLWVLELLVLFLKLNRFGILLGELGEDQVVSSVIGGILSIEARDMDTKLLSAPESNNTLARCWFRRNVPMTTFRHDKLLTLVADCFWWLALWFCTSWSDDPPCFNWGGIKSPKGFLPSILLLAVIIIAVAIIVTVVLVVVAAIIGVVVVVGDVSSIIKLSFVIIGWAYAFHQDKASSVRVPVANVTLFSSAHLTLKKCIKKSDFRWTTEAEQAFQQLKQHLSKLPLLVTPKPQEELIMYLSATYGAVSAVLMTERGTTQTPIYFISCALHGLELNYSPMEKLVMTRPDVAGRLKKWSIILGEHNITYRPRTSVKGQILAYFLTEMPGDVLQAASAAITQEEP
uniref:Reverse transcriptase domain-containing protein n=1 Tax=Tanacetum cinerariifolium TaxID=118510 RepID=A0A6L2MPW1_TANCI|nr:reverse transcriptase domain-containing protein [Tanacetum cinerariifolium]